MKLGEIIKIRGVLFKHKDTSAAGVSFSVKYKIAKFLYETDQEVSFFEAAHADVKKDFFDAEGNLIKEKQGEYEGKINALLNTETDRNIEFEIGELEHFDLSVADTICLYGCIREAGEQDG